MKVIVISGKAQHGKDTTAGYLKDALSNDGKRVLITHYGDLVKYVCTKFFDWDGVKDDKGRTLLQFVGTDIVRTKKPDYWVDFVCDIVELFSNQWDYVLIPDCRFPNEVEKCKERGLDTLHIRVTRPNFDNGLTPKQKAHASEVALDDYKPDIKLINDGSLDELQARIDVIAKSI
ncbi:MAG: hypothetical protein PHR82_08740 [Endomicrobiaceae bacterium]|nr:hypothetical protein [Endomicrobiaceae bacterium]